MKKKLIVIALILILFLGDYLYWTIPFSLGKTIPEENWNRAQLWYYDEHFDAREILISNETLQRIVTNINAERVTNGPRFRTVSQPYFMLYLYYDEGYPCSFTIVENGDISVVTELDTDHRKYFDNGAELYEYLRILTRNLPAVFSAS